MKLKFAQFEKAANLLENSPEDVSDDVLLENNLTREELEKINEGLLGDIFGGIFKKLKEKILKAIPGSVLKKADAILKEYKDTEMSIYDKTKKERDKIYVASVEDKDSPRNKEQITRSEKAIEAIEAASRSKKDAINKKLQLIIKDKSEIVRNYVNMQTYQIQEDIANKQLEDAQESASEEELDKLEKIVAEKKKKKEAAGKAIENAKVEAGKKQEADDKKKDEQKKNDPAKATAGQTWKTKNGNDVEILKDLGNGRVSVKGKSGAESKMIKGELESLVKDVEVKK